MLNRKLLRPLALAAAGCLLAVSLVGCGSKDSQSDSSSAASSASSAASEAADSAASSSQENGKADSGAAASEEAVSGSAAEHASGTSQSSAREDAVKGTKTEPAAPSSGSSSSRNEAASSSKSTTTSSSSGKQYDAPSAECDAKIESLKNELYSLQASAQSAISAALEAAKEEYHALPADQQTDNRKYNIAYSHLSSAQSEYDRKVASVIRQMRRVLDDYNQPQTIADEAESYYESSKQDMISRLS